MCNTLFYPVWIKFLMKWSFTSICFMNQDTLLGLSTIVFGPRWSPEISTLIAIGQTVRIPTQLSWKILSWMHQTSQRTRSHTFSRWLCTQHHCYTGHGPLITGCRRLIKDRCNLSKGPSSAVDWDCVIYKPEQGISLIPPRFTSQDSSEISESNHWQSYPTINGALFQAKRGVLTLSCSVENDDTKWTKTWQKSL